MLESTGHVNILEKVPRGLIKVTGYHKWAWFKNNLVKVFSACNYYAGIVVMLCLSGVYEVSQRYKNWYSHTLHRRRDIAGIQFKFSP